MARLYDGPVGPLLRATWAPWQGGGSVQEQVSKVHPGASRGPEPGGAAAVTQWPLTGQGVSGCHFCLPPATQAQRGRGPGWPSGSPRARPLAWLLWSDMLEDRRTGSREPSLLCPVIRRRPHPSPALQLCNKSVSPEERVPPSESSWYH